MLHVTSRQSLSIGLATVFLLGAHSAVMAQNPQTRGADQVREATTPTPRQFNPVAELKLRSLPTNAAQGTLSGKNLPACQSRAEAISQNITRATDNADAIRQKLDSIAEKVQAFQVAQDITLENDDFMVNDLQTKKQDSLKAVEAAKTKATDFACDSEGPKEQLRQFVMAMDTVREALQSYRAAVYTYIGLVRQGDFAPPTPTGGN